MVVFVSSSLRERAVRGARGGPEGGGGKQGPARLVRGVVCVCVYDWEMEGGGGERGGGIEKVTQ